MATVHVYVRAQVVGEPATVAAVATLAEQLNTAITDAGGRAGTVTVVDDPPADDTPDEHADQGDDADVTR